MSTLVLEGTWEEIVAHTAELAGKRVRLSVEADEPQPTVQPNTKMLDTMREADEIQQGMNPKPNGGGLVGMEDIPVVGPPNEKMLGILRDIAERQKGRRYTSGEDTQNLIRQARNGGMYGLESLDE